MQEQILSLPCPQCNNPIRLKTRWSWVLLEGRWVWLPIHFEGICHHCSAFVQEIEVDSPNIKIKTLRPSPNAKLCHEGV